MGIVCSSAHGVACLVSPTEELDTRQKVALVTLKLRRKSCNFNHWRLLSFATRIHEVINV